MKDLAERFWEKVRIGGAGDCWIWTASKIRNGYGRISSGGGGPVVLAHRVSWELSHGSVPDGLYVCHRCDVRDCVNPEHLFLGTQSENMRDCIQKGRGNKARGERQHLSVLTEENVREIRDLLPHATRASIARKFGVTRENISQIAHRKTWRHVP